MVKQFKPGQPAPKSGIYGVMGPRGGDTKKEVIAEKGDPLPPTKKPGEGYQLKRPARH
ncbi:MAG: YjzC family protein [Candidatus Staskawiczbacteria bacterium]|jgi:hypothetical protein